MKAVILKQRNDCFSSWKSFVYENETPLNILSYFKGKAGFPYEFILELKSDFIITKESKNIGWINNARGQNPNYQKAIDEYSQTGISIFDVDLTPYDIVYFQDPYIDEINKLKQLFPRAIFVYVLCEHGDTYLHNNNYDLFLDHTLNSSDTVEKLPQFVNFPLLRSPNNIRKIFNTGKQPLVFFDHRTLTYLVTNQKNISWGDYVTSAINEINNKLSNLKVIHNGEAATAAWMVHYPPKPNDALAYNLKLAKSKYYVSTSGRIGQSIGEAASHNCICLGVTQSKIHNLLCHPETLFKNIPTLDEVVNKLNKIEADERLQAEILEYQNTLLIQNFVEKPLNNFKKALDIKK